jgi:DNA-binding MarR family transcriptional regulator
MHLHVNDRQALHTLASALRHFEEISKDSAIPTPLSLITTFIHIALWPGKTVSELAKMVGASPVSMTRQLGDLGEINRYDEPGLGLVEQCVEVSDRRYSRVSLSAKGHAFVGKIASALAGEVREAA